MEFPSQGLRLPRELPLLRLLLLANFLCWTDLNRAIPISCELLAKLVLKVPTWSQVPV